MLGLRNFYYILLLFAPKYDDIYNHNIINHLCDNINKEGVISEASRNTRYGTGSVVKTAVRNLLTDYYRTDSEQVNSQATFLMLFVLLFGMTKKGLANNNIIYIQIGPKFFCY